MFYRPAYLAVSCVALIAPGPAFATDAAPEAPDQTIIVTGERSQEAIAPVGRLGVLGDLEAQDTPFSITSFSEDFIRDTQALSISDLLARDASILIDNAPRGSTYYDSPYIRGFNLPAADTVALNGLYGLASYTPTIDNVARVDLIKGPSAFLTGAPAGVGGTINFELKRAGDSPLSRAGLDYLSESVFGGTIDLGRRFADGRFGARFNGTLRGGDVAIGDGDLEQRVASLALDYRGETFRVALDAVYDYKRNRGYSYYLTLGPEYPIETGLPEAPDGALGIAPGWMGYTNDNIAVLGRADWDFAQGWSATAAYGASWFEGGYDSYCLASLANRAGDVSCFSFGSNGEVRGQSADLGITGRFSTGPVTHDLIAGAARIRNTVAYSFYAMPNPSDPEGLFRFNIYERARPARVPFPEDPGTVPFNERITTSAYVGDTLGLFEGKVTATLGLRWVQIEQKNFVFGGGQLQDANKSDKVTPAVAVTFQPNDALTFYGNYVQALEPGSTAPQDALNAGEAFPPLVSNQIELGIKGKYRGLTGSIAFYRIAKANTFLDPSTAPPTFVQNGRQVNKGVELSLTGSIVEGVRIVSSASWINAKQTETAGGQFDGLRVSGVPRFSGRVSGEVDLPFAAGLTLTAGVQHNGSAEYDNSETLTLPGWTKWEAGARYRFRLGPTALIARVLIDNLTSSDYFVGSYSNFIAVSPPRTLSASLTAEF